MNEQVKEQARVKTINELTDIRGRNQCKEVKSKLSP